MLRFICADLPLARMPDRSDKQEEETSSEDDRYYQYGSDDNQEIEDKAPMAKKNVIKLAVRESSVEDKDHGSTSKGTKRPLKDSDRPMLKKAKVSKQDEKEESRENKSKQKEGKTLALEQKSSNLENSDDEEDDSDVDDDSDSSQEESTATRSHHPRVKCRMPGCKVVVGDIKRHVLTHAKKQEIEDDDVLRAVAIMKVGKKNRGARLTSKKCPEGRPGRLKKWCPASNCFFISPQINVHLKSSHKIKPGTALYNNMLKDARVYTGLQELQVLLRTPPPVAAPLSLLVPAATPDSASASASASASVSASVPLAAPVVATAAMSALASTSENKEQHDSHDSEESSYEPGDESSDGASESEESQPAKLKKQEYYSATTYESNRHQWLCGYFRYLQLPDAGYKKLANRLQHVGQMRNLLEALDPAGKDITVLAEDDGDAVWLKWVHPHLTDHTKAPGTIISYLTSFEKFLKFVTSKKYNRKEMPPLHGNHEDIFWETIPALKGWRATVDNETQDIQHRGHLRECDSMLTPQDIKKLQESKPYAAGMKALMKAKQGETLSLPEFSEARDLLLVKLSLLVGSRPGPLENVNLEDYHSAKESGENKIMLVPKHKRSKAGPASLGMDKELQELMEIYVTKLRPQIAEEGEDKLFVKKNGSAFERNTIRRRFSAFWEKSGVRSDKSISQTSVRKFVTTTTKKHAPEEVSRVQKVLSHSERASRNCYLRQDLTEEASLAIDVIKRVTSTDIEKSTKKEDIETKAEKDEKDQSKTKDGDGASNGDGAADGDDAADGHDASDHDGAADGDGPTDGDGAVGGDGASDGDGAAGGDDASDGDGAAGGDGASDGEAPEVIPPTPPRPLSQKKAQPSRSHKSNTKPIPTTSTSQQTQPSSSPSQGLTDREKDTIKEVFKDDIEAGVKVQMKMVRNKMCTRTILRKLIYSKAKVKKVVNMINYLIETRPRTKPEDLPAKKPEVTDWLCDDSVSLKSGPRQHWDDKDTQAIERIFTRFDSCPTKDVIRDMFNKDDELMDIKEKEGFTRCYEKVKSMMKKKKKK